MGSLIKRKAIKRPLLQGLVIKQHLNGTRFSSDFSLDKQTR